MRWHFRNSSYRREGIWKVPVVDERASKKMSLTGPLRDPYGTLTGGTHGRSKWPVEPTRNRRGARSRTARACFGAEGAPRVLETCLPSVNNPRDRPWQLTAPLRSWPGRPTTHLASQAMLLHSHPLNCHLIYNCYFQMPFHL